MTKKRCQQMDKKKDEITMKRGKTDINLQRGRLQSMRPTLPFVQSLVPGHGSTTQFILGSKSGQQQGHLIHANDVGFVHQSLKMQGI
jgi:hypothetical protein